VNQYAVPPGDPGGTRHYDLASTLMHLGWAVEIVASDLSLATRTYRKRSSRLDARAIHDTVGGVPFTYLWAGSYQRNDWRRVLSMLLFGISAAGLLTFRRLRDHTIFIGSSPHLFAAFGTWLASVVRRRSFIFEVRDLWPESYAEVSGGGEGGIPYRLMRWMADVMYRRSDAIIVLAEANRERVAARGADPSKVSCIPNGVNLQEFAEPVSEFSPRTGAVRFIYTGAHGPANGLDVVVRACAALERDGVDDIEVLLVGDGPAKAELASLVKQLGVGNIEMRGLIPKNEIPELLRTADVGLMILAPVELFSYGVSPNKLFDYLAANLPVLTNVPGLVAEIVRTAGAGYACDAGDPEALAAGMRTMASEVRADPMRFRSGRTFVRQHYDRQVLAGQLDELLQVVLAAQR
jgi:glycosyltransferase involved in cell wall biosynthesis